MGSGFLAHKQNGFFKSQQPTIGCTDLALTEQKCSTELCMIFYEIHFLPHVFKCIEMHVYDLGKQIENWKIIEYTQFFIRNLSRGSVLKIAYFLFCSLLLRKLYSIVSLT